MRCKQRVWHKEIVKKCLENRTTNAVLQYFNMYSADFVGGGYINLPLVAKSVFPLSTGIWWYPTTYAVFLLISPYLYKGIRSLSKKELQGLIVVMIILWSVTTLVPFFSYGSNNFLCFVMLYAIVFYIRNHASEKKYNKKLYILMIVIGYILAFLSIVFMDLLGTKIGLAAEYSCYFIRGNYRILPMIISVGIFLWSLNLRLQSRAVNYIASLMFGVYLIHMYPPIETLLFTRVFDISSIINNAYLPLITSADILLLFVACSAIEAFRKILFTYVFDRLECRIFSKINLFNGREEA